MIAIRYSRCPVKFLIWILITLLNSFVSSVSASLGDALVNVTFTPPYVDQLKENTNRTVWIRVSIQRQYLDGKYALDTTNFNGTTAFNKTRPFGSSTPPSQQQRPQYAVIDFKTEDSSIAKIVDPPRTASIPRRVIAFDRAMTSGSNGTNMDDGDEDDDDAYWRFNTSFTIHGLFLGKTKLGIHLMALNEEQVKRWINNGSTSMVKENGSDYRVQEYTFDVWVIRHDKKLTHIFVGTLVILLIVANVLMGAHLNLNVVMEVIKKPLAPAIGFLCQFLIMPMISYGLAMVFFVPVGLYGMGLGLFTTGCSPGGGASNAYTVLLDGNVDLSITMTFLSTLLSLATMPMWMFMLGRQFLVQHPGQRISVPYASISYSLMMLVLPLCVGVLLRRFFPKVADITRKALRPFLGLIIVFICTFGVYVNLYMFRLMTWRVLVGGMALPWMGFVFGYVIASVCRQPKPNVKAISIETGIQNTGIAIMLLQLSFVQPEDDLAAVLPVVVAMFTPAPMIVALLVHYYGKWRDEKQKREEQAVELKTDEEKAIGENNNAQEKDGDEEVRASDSRDVLLEA